MPDEHRRLDRRDLRDVQLRGTLEKIGAKSEAIKSAPLKDIGSPLHDLRPDERAVLQGTVDEYFAKFKTLVIEHRHLTDQAVIARATDGRVFSGDGARQIGLVDQTGLLEDAIDLARELGNAKGGRAIFYREPYGPSGSIYAQTSVPQPQAQTPALIQLPTSAMSIPTGFYYLWKTMSSRGASYLQLRAARHARRVP